MNLSAMNTSRETSPAAYLLAAKVDSASRRRRPGSTRPQLELPSCAWPLPMLWSLRPEHDRHPPVVPSRSSSEIIIFVLLALRRRFCFRAIRR